MGNNFLNGNKKGDDKFITPWLFLIWLLIGVAIVLGVLIFYGLAIDVREPESGILTWKVVDCFNDRGYFNVDVLKDDFDFYNECGLSKKVLDESGLYYLRIFVYESKPLISMKKKEFEIGKKDLEMQCKLGETVSKDKEKYPQCGEEIVKINDIDGNLYLINIFTASDQKGARL